MLQSRELLEQNLIRPTSLIKQKKKIVKDIKKHLVEKHSIFDGTIQSFINDPSNLLKGTDLRLLYLFAEQVYQKTSDQEINPELFFTPAEIKAARQYSGKMFIEEEVKFPLHFENALQSSRDSWIVMMDIKTIVDLVKARKLNWNPEAQREATYKEVGGQIIQTATLYYNNIYQMVQLMKEGKLEVTQLILNCSLGTGEIDEVVYDEHTRELIINDCKIDIIDGANRIKACELVLEQMPDIDFKFEVKILNVTVPRAASFLEQLSRAVPISLTKRKVMRRETELDILMKDLMEKSVLKDRISEKEGLTKKRKELVTYNMLANSIEKHFSIEKKVDRVKVTDYLTEFFEALLSYYETEFTTEYAKYKKESLISDNNTFAGYILLASKMYSNGIDPWKVNKFIGDIEFSRSSQHWKDWGILDFNENLTKNVTVNMEKFFNEISV